MTFLSKAWAEKERLNERILELERQHRQDLERQDALANELEDAQVTIDALRHVIQLLRRSIARQAEILRNAQDLRNGEEAEQ